MCTMWFRTMQLVDVQRSQVTSASKLTTNPQQIEVSGVWA